MVIKKKSFVTRQKNKILPDELGEMSGGERAIFPILLDFSICSFKIK
jgi:hypothetical protein